MEGEGTGALVVSVRFMTRPDPVDFGDTRL